MQNEKSQTHTYNSLSCFKNRFGDSRMALGCFSFSHLAPLRLQGAYKYLTIQCDSVPHKLDVCNSRILRHCERVQRTWQSTSNESQKESRTVDYFTPLAITDSKILDKA